ncbi:monooxygenase [Alcaligenes sp. SDU_A2]|uniref:monooxygenase n=1 Tax=Alcaligenes sp. SDU_A2 TaxID=3136634 RepID=UPI002CB5AFAE|nr:monooxygenase [Alcaligenes sp.]HRL26735.1 monooxygenase [Alcaligenes sp.]
MSTVLYVDFPYPGPWGADMSAAMRELAESIAQEPGLIWKIWTENQAERTAGGVYLFTDHAHAQAYLEMHTRRLNSFGIDGVQGRLFEVNHPLSEIDRGPV